MNGGIGSLGVTSVWNSPSPSPAQILTAPISVIDEPAAGGATRGLEVDDDERGLAQRRAQLVEGLLHGERPGPQRGAGAIIRREQAAHVSNGRGGHRRNPPPTREGSRVAVAPVVRTTCSVTSPGVAPTRRASTGRRTVVRCDHEARTDHGDHGAGWQLPGGVPAREGLRGPRPDPAVVDVQHLAHRPPLRGPARAGRTPVPALRRPVRRRRAWPRLLADGPAGRGLQPRRAVPRAGQLRRTGVHRQHHRRSARIRLLEAIRMVGLDCRFYQASSSEMFGAYAAAAGRGRRRSTRARPYGGGQGLRATG